jgi:hypothetical protein
MVVTREWLERVSDEKGLTRGQIRLLDIHTGGAPYVGKTVSDFVANFVEQCRGYRGMPEELRRWLNRV